MPNYIRSRVEDATYFLTLVTHERRAILTAPLARKLLHQAIAHVQRSRPFEIRGSVFLPDHLHILCHTPKDDSDYSTRIGQIKKRFTMAYLAAGGPLPPIRAGLRVSFRDRGAPSSENNNDLA